MVIRTVRFMLGLVTALGIAFAGLSCARDGLWFSVWNLYIAAAVISVSLMASAFELPLTLLCFAALSATAVALALHLDSPMAAVYVAGMMVMSVTVLVTVLPGKEAHPDLRRYKE
jgi:uncharacterized membrane protein YoaK (UPF0700 family)